MAATLAPHVRALNVLAPQAAGAGPASPLPHLASCRRLRSLTLCHATPAALEEGLASLTALQSLHVTVHWEAAGLRWLDFAAHLTGLQVGGASQQSQPHPVWKLSPGGLGFTGGPCAPS